MLLYSFTQTPGQLVDEGGTGAKATPSSSHGRHSMWRTFPAAGSGAAAVRAADSSLDG